MTRLQLLVLLFALVACAGGSGAEESGESPPSDSPSQSEWPEFNADPSAKMTVDQWNALLQEVKSRPGAVVDDDGSMLTTVNVVDPEGNGRSFFLFTKPTHPAHPAYIAASPGAADETDLVVGYAGPQPEFEAFVRAFLERLRRSQ